MGHVTRLRTFVDPTGLQSPRHKTHRIARRAVAAPTSADALPHPLGKAPRDNAAGPGPLDSQPDIGLHWLRLRSELCHLRANARQCPSSCRGQAKPRPVRGFLFRRPSTTTGRALRHPGQAVPRHSVGRHRSAEFDWLRCARRRFPYNPGSPEDPKASPDAWSRVWPRRTHCRLWWPVRPRQASFGCRERHGASALPEPPPILYATGAQQHFPGLRPGCRTQAPTAPPQSAPACRRTPRAPTPAATAGSRPVPSPIASCPPAPIPDSRAAPAPPAPAAADASCVPGAFANKAEIAPPPSVAACCDSLPASQDRPAVPVMTPTTSCATRSVVSCGRSRPSASIARPT